MAINEITDITEIGKVKVYMLKGEKGESGGDESQIRADLEAEIIDRKRADIAISNDIDDLQESATETNAEILTISAEVAVERARIDQIVSGGNVQEVEETLWTGTAQGTGDSISLSKAISEFNYLDIYSWKQGDKPIFTIPAVETGSGADPISLEFPNVADSTNNTQMWIAEIQLTVAEQAINITHQYSWYWTGVSSASATWAEITHGSSLVQYEPYIYKVVGRKVITNAEVEDLRVGADGVTYSDAGTAVRTQLNNKMDKDPDAVSGDIAVFDTNHNAVDSGVSKNDIVYTSNNLWTKGNVGSFVKTSGVVQLDDDLELNTTYTFTSDVVSDDTYSTDCRVYLVMKRTGNTSNVYFLINRGDRQSATFTTPNDEIINGFVFYASRTASQSTGDTATFSNIQLEKGSTATRYIPHYTANDYVARNYPKQIVEKTKWLALGDSITLGVYSEVVNGTAEEQLGKGWVSYLADAFDYDLKILGSRGMGYTASITGKDPDNPDGNRIDLNTLLTRAEALTDDYNLITIAFGTNDYSEPSQSTSASIISGLSDAINRLANKWKSARIIVITPFNKCTTNAGTLASKWDCLIPREQNNLSLHDVAQVIETTALQLGCDCINVTDASCLNVYNISKTLSDADRLLPDKTHPSIAGHKLIAKYMANKIMG